MLYSILVSIDVLIAAALIALVLLQQGKGANAGAAFGGGGGGASGTVFGAKGSSSFMSRATALLAAAFFINSIVLAYLATNRPVAESVMGTEAVQEQQIDIPEVPADIPGVVNIPEGTSSEEMMDIIKTEIEKKAAEQTDASTEQLEQTVEDAQKVIEENADSSLPADIPQ